MLHKIVFSQHGTLKHERIKVLLKSICVAPKITARPFIEEENKGSMWFINRDSSLVLQRFLLHLFWMQVGALPDHIPVA